MGRKVFLAKRCKQQLNRMHATGKTCFGLIIGQPSKAGPEYVVHLAQTKVKEDVESSDDEGEPGPPRLIPSVRETSLIDHCMDALRMLPGSFFVLGLFVVTPSLPDESSNDFKFQLEALVSMGKTLQKNDWIYGSTDHFESEDKLLLNYSGENSIRLCTVTLDADAKRSAVPFEFQEEPIDWAQMRITLDEPFCFRITRSIEGNLSISDNFRETLRVLHGRLKNSTIFVDNDPTTKNGNSSIDILFKVDNKTVRDVSARLYFSVEEPYDEKYLRVDRWSGFIKCMGDVSSHIFIHPNLLVKDATRFVQTDIMRSISGRLRLYLDTYSGLGNEQRVQQIYHLKPPRRVYFKAFDDSPIKFTDFLFNVEGPQQVLVNAKNTFRIRLNVNQVDDSVEKMRFPREELVDEMRKPTSDFAKLVLNGADFLCYSFIGIVLFGAICAFCVGMYFNYQYGLNEELERDFKR